MGQAAALLDRDGTGIIDHGYELGIAEDIVWVGGVLLAETVHVHRTLAVYREVDSRHPRPQQFPEFPGHRR